MQGCQELGAPCITARDKTAKWSKLASWKEWTDDEYKRMYRCVTCTMFLGGFETETQAWHHISQSSGQAAKEGRETGRNRDGGRKDREEQGGREGEEGWKGRREEEKWLKGGKEGRKEERSVVSSHDMYFFSSAAIVAAVLLSPRSVNLNFVTSTVLLLSLQLVL